MRTLAAVAAASLCSAAFAACGSDTTPSTPDACLQGAEPFLSALASAPGEVRLEGGTPISGCIVPSQQAGDLTAVGEGLVVAATRLNVQGRADPAGPAPLELGYLAGAVQKGAEDTAGIHADLLRRLDSAARFTPGALPPEFSDGYDEGLAAGRKSG